MRNMTLVIGLSLILLSCEKDEQLVIENQQLIVENLDIPLIIKELHDGEVYKEYTYNDRNLLFEEKTKWYYTSHTYNGNNLLTDSDFYVDKRIVSSDIRVLEEAGNREEWVNPDNTEKSLTQTFEYNVDGQLIRKVYTRPSVSNSEYNEYTYENNRISRQTMYWQDVISFFIDYEYDENGNMIKESKYHVSSDGLSELWTTTEYEFDHMHNPFQSFKRLLTPGINTNPNNIVKRIYTIHFEVDESVEKVQIREYSYEYNTGGYPVKVNDEVDYVYM